MIAAPSNAAVDTLLEKLVLTLSAHTSTVVRLGRVGGDTHGKDRTDRFYLQRYELDGGPAHRSVPAEQGDADEERE
mgnify:CR=1 FL=1